VLARAPRVQTAARCCHARLEQRPATKLQDVLVSGGCLLVGGMVEERYTAVEHRLQKERAIYGRATRCCLGVHGTHTMETNRREESCCATG
jgi:hypothetical protein